MNGTGSITGPIRTSYNAHTANATINATQHYLNATNNSFTYTLPTAASISGREYYIANSGNGGSNVRNIEDYVNGYLQKRVNLPITKIGLIIYQFTSQYRDYINQSHTKEGWLTGDIMPIEQQIEFVNNEITKWESKGIKVVTLSWYDDFPNHPLYQKYFKDRHVDIEIDGDTKNSFEYFLHRDEYNVTIASDFGKKGFQKNDIHFNPKGHRCIAKSIIKKLNNDSWKPI